MQNRMSNRKTPHAWHTWIRRLKINKRLALSFAILSLIPMLVTGWFAYQQSSTAIKDKISTYSIQVMDQVSLNIQNELSKLENDSVDIAFSDSVQDTLRSFDQLDGWGKNAAEIRINNLLSRRFSFVPSVTDVHLFTEDREQINAYGDFAFRFRLKPAYLNHFLDDALDQSGKPIWTIQSVDDEQDGRDVSYRADVYGNYGILLGRSFRSLEEGTTLGFMLIRMHGDFILNKYQHIDLGQGVDIFILNEEGRIISSRTPDIIPARMYDDPSLIQKIHAYEKEGVYSFRHTIAGAPYLITYSFIPSANWYLISTIPFTYLNDESIQIGMSIAILGIACFLFALLLSFLVSKSISRPLHTLIKSMNQAKSGKFPTLIQDYNNDELGVVTEHFNKMVQDLKRVVNELKHNEKLKRQAELNALQSQINPHFLSNTLNNIRWLADLQKADNISNVIQSLIQLLHASTWKKDELVTIKEEMDYVKHYLNIMTYRHYDKFNVHYQVEEEVLSCNTLKFLLQPIVENAVLHGLEPLHGQGLIVIKAYRIEDQIKISVTDNGVGISEQQLSKLMQKKHEVATIRDKGERVSGIGIWNVDQRIKLYFGEEFGVSIQSVPDLYTTIELTVPVIIRQEGEEAS